MTEAEEKLKYAELLLKEREPFTAALSLFPDDTSRALWVANHWLNDPVVCAEKKRLNDEEGDSFLLSKREFLQNIELRMQSARTADEYSKVAKLYADVRGFIEKPQTNVNITNNIPRIAEIPVFANQEECEAETLRSQTELLKHARTRH